MLNARAWLIASVILFGVATVLAVADLLTREPGPLPIGQSGALAIASGFDRLASPTHHQAGDR
jgi:hypothetical protein